VVEWLEFTLRAWDRNGRKIPRADFLDRLAFDPADTARAESGPGAQRVRLLSVSREEFAHVDTTQDAGAQSEAFAAALHEGLVEAAKWLTRQPVAVFEELRAVGHVTDVFIDGWMDQDQLDLDLAAEFVQACGKLGLSISVCTNE